MNSRAGGVNWTARAGLIVFSLRHHDEEDSAFVPAAEPADSPIIDTIAQRHQLAKAKELGLNVHGHLRPDTSIARLGRTVKGPSANRPQPHCCMLISSRPAFEAQIDADNRN